MLLAKAPHNKNKPLLENFTNTFIYFMGHHY